MLPSLKQNNLFTKQIPSFTSSKNNFNARNPTTNKRKSTHSLLAWCPSRSFLSSLMTLTAEIFWILTLTMTNSSFNPFATSTPFPHCLFPNLFDSLSACNTILTFNSSHITWRHRLTSFPYTLILCEPRQDKTKILKLEFWHYVIFLCKHFIIL